MFSENSHRTAEIVLLPLSPPLPPLPPLPETVDRPRPPVTLLADYVRQVDIGIYMSVCE